VYLPNTSVHPYSYTSHFSLFLSRIFFRSYWHWLNEWIIEDELRTKALLSAGTGESLGVQTDYKAHGLIIRLFNDRVSNTEVNVTNWCRGLPDCWDPDGTVVTYYTIQITCFCWRGWEKTWKTMSRLSVIPHTNLYQNLVFLSSDFVDPGLRNQYHYTGWRWETGKFEVDYEIPPRGQVPSAHALRTWVRNFEETGSALKKKA
jgi:hypothetical protein